MSRQMWDPPDAHLLFVGSGRYGEDYEVRDRASGRRLGCVNGRDRKWEAIADDGTRLSGAARWRVSVDLWPDCEAA